MNFFRFLFFFAVFKLASQTTSPKSINYQGIARDISGNPITSTFDLEFVIKDATSIVHSEIQTNIQPNAIGLFSTLIGLAPNTLTVSSWDNGPYTLNVSIKTGSTFTLVGSQSFASVPYALHSANVPSSYTNNILTIGNNSYTLTPSTIISNTIIGTGLASVTPSTGSQYSINVPNPSLSYTQVGNILTLTQGSVVSTVTLTSSGNGTINILGSGIANVNPISGNAFTVSVPSPSLNFSTSNILSLTQGTALSSVTLNPNLNGDLIGTLSTITVTAIRNNPISPLTPSAGQILSFQSGSWTPTNQTPDAWQTTNNNVSLLVPTNKVGIGTSLPTAILEVTGAATTTSDIIKVSNINSSNSSAVMNVNTNGTLGLLINETSSNGGSASKINSSQGMAIGASSSGLPHTIQSTNSNLSTSAYAGFFDGGLITKGKTSASNGNALTVQNFSTTNLMVVRNDGNVGIGTPNPNTMLHVAGKTTIADGTQGDGKILTSDSNGSANWKSSPTPYYFTNLNSAATSVSSTGTSLITPNMPISKLYTNSEIHIDMHSKISVGSFGGGATKISFQIKVDGNTSTYSTIHYMFLGNSAEYVDLKAIFTGLAAGPHTISIYAKSDSGNVSNVTLDPGGYGGAIIVKEFN